ncbi:MAG TPA: M28 family peptidase, partial [Gemmataceae bacterium]|nr:M28 family peptidase [Gemmataceae bacterium]
MAMHRGMTRFGILVLAGLMAGSSGSVRADNPVEARMRRDLTFLSSDQCEGRGVTTRGINLAADYIAKQFQKAGLKPARDASGYFQPFTMPGNVLDGVPTVVLRGPDGQFLQLEEGKQFEPLGLTGSGKASAAVVFAGYGITASKYHYDDYKGLDVTGKIVIILRDTPRPGQKGGLFSGFERMLLASFTSKLQNAAKHGAAAVLFVNDSDTARQTDQLLHFEYISMAGKPVKIPAFHVARAVVDRLMRASLDHSLSDVEGQIDRDLRPHSLPLAGWSADVAVEAHRGTIPLKNVVGVVEGSGPLADECVVIGAHYDHLGYGVTSASLSRSKNPAIHHGADDNGSGTTALMELARRFGRMKDRQGRRLVFIAFSGEEMGLLGSDYYVHHPLYSLGETAAMVNMDMVGRLRPDHPSWKSLLAVLTPPSQGLPETSLAALAESERAHLLPPGPKLIVYGTGSAQSFNRVIDRIDRKYGFRLSKVP